jgi:nucleoside-diphosphate-sugar epimerase
MKVLVTGASGFVGGAVCAELLARGHETLALVRRIDSQPAGTRGVLGDLTDKTIIGDALREAEPECVIHLAAEIGTQRDPRKIAEVNINGMRRLLAACESVGTRRLVFASTVVTGDARGEILTEDKPLPVETAYGRSKQEGERLLGESSLEGVVVRPGHIYGPGGWYIGEIVARLRQPGRFVVLGAGSNWWDMVHVDDVAVAMIEAAERAPAETTFHCVDDEPVTQYDFIALTARELGVGAPRRVPVWLARMAAGADPVRAAVRSARTSNTKLKRELGWAPRYPNVQAGVPAALASVR